MSFREKKSRNPLEFRLARDKDQKDVIVSNISDAENKSQDIFSRFFRRLFSASHFLAYRCPLRQPVSAFISFNVRAEKRFRSACMRVEKAHNVNRNA
jgi:hypothetical protein